ncbi:hypothetical protein SERLA73DRAFT_176851 [Serpula lacrymans var. lacrymans S7.3]|uniref:C2H2-type domain-containing protein n=2 Tax=Serpula lacrymans var. lacrymans TaxID=341189 RepID=F8PQC1_SERL3|nr:uncharacterized protein SERLADRAFT_460139 [Serpula lacrymans var. lacrymans S7.9]EGO01534.1 hypothetical protein SERLA73DRAFT_176851 [Serpula lacrymans var. lacrymans S7.3]EGO27187.1 hypothetical protein SERLADRAFT_460139 [Serpula lacrymans var. lacrymans S7.9]
MSSWSTTAFPPPTRHSRSRSPTRGGHPPRPPYPDPAYPQDPYRGGWDPYDRERAWADHERDRATYEYGRRGRSRSPPPDETGRKRRRSMSPYERDRYEPRPRYGDDYDAHSRAYGYRSPGRGQYAAPFPPSRRAPPDPRTFDHPATLKQYAEWFRYCFPQQATEEDNADKAAEQEAGDGSKPRNGIRSRWEKYKKEFMANQLQTMFDHHRKSPWFAEKYDPSEEHLALRRRVRKEGWAGRLNTFLHDLESGKFDPDLNESEAEPTSPMKESINGETNITDSTAAIAPAEESKVANGEDEMQFNMDPEEDVVDHEVTRTETNGKPVIDNRRNNRGEEISVPPEGNQVMIRTIPPDIGRVKLEDACGKVPGFMYLALGDPLQKRNYYRAGWLRFRDDADMAIVMSELTEKKIEGFKLHVTHNLRPFINRVRYVPEVASKPDRLEKDLANARALASILEEDAAHLRKFRAPKTEGQVNAGTGDNENAGGDEDEVMTDGREDGEDDPEPKESGSEAVERRIEKVMTDLREQGLVDVNDEKALEARKTVISLDLYLAYLRAAFHSCYYCAVVTDHAEELQRKCLKHMRKPLSKLLLEEVKAAEAEKAEKEKKEKDEEKEKEASITTTTKPTENRDWKRNDERWLEWFDLKIALLINRDGIDPRDYGGKSYDDELTKAVEPYIKQEDEGKYRCKTCQKLFKATSFVEKHIANKHAELVKHLDEVPYFNNFALDPHRIQPFSHPPPSVGNSQAPPPQAYGIQGPPTTYPPPDYGRASFYGGHPQGYAIPPPYNNGGGGYWDPYAYQYGGGVYPTPALPVPRRDEATTARRLSDRISGYATGYEQPMETTIPAGAGLPAKPMVTLEPIIGGNGERGGRKGGRGGGIAGGPPPPPPPDAKEDPRAAAGKKVSYHDMDLVAEGDVELTY